MELAYRCQMLSEKALANRVLAVQALLNAGWKQDVINDSIDAALSWARSQRLTAKQEKYRRTRQANKSKLKNDDALDVMFSSMGSDPAEIPRRKEFDLKVKGNAVGHITASYKGENPMGLGLSTGGSSGDIKPFVKYDAKAGRLFRADRNQQSDGSFASESVEITNTAQFVIDLANIRVGWINYTSQGPIRRLIVLGKEPIPPRPDDKGADGKLAFKQGFEVDLLLNKETNGGNTSARILGSAAGCVIEAMDALHDAYSAASESKTGKLPIVKIAGVSPVKSGQSTNYKPEFAIIGWTDRPAGLPNVDGALQKVSSPSTAPSTGSTQVGAPVPQQAAMASASDFG